MFKVSEQPPDEVVDNARSQAGIPRGPSDSKLLSLKSKEDYEDSLKILTEAVETMRRNDSAYGKLETAKRTAEINSDQMVKLHLSVDMDQKKSIESENTERILIPFVQSLLTEESSNQFAMITREFIGKGVAPRLAIILRATHDALHLYAESSKWEFAKKNSEHILTYLRDKATEESAKTTSERMQPAEIVNKAVAHFQSTRFVQDIAILHACIIWVQEIFTMESPVSKFIGTALQSKSSDEESKEDPLSIPAHLHNINTLTSQGNNTDD